jgi:hypothetical protein
VANCFAAIEHHKTGRDIPMLGPTSAESVAERALTAQRTMEHQKRLWRPEKHEKSRSKVNCESGVRDGMRPLLNETVSIGDSRNPMKREEDHEMEYEKVREDEHTEMNSKKSLVDAMKRVQARLIQAKLPGPMKYAHDSLKAHYRYLARFSQQLCITFRAKGVFWVGDNQVYNQNFVSALSDDLLYEFYDHPKASWIHDVPIYSQMKSVNINLLGVLFTAKVLAKEAFEANARTQLRSSGKILENSTLANLVSASIASLDSDTHRSPNKIQNIVSAVLANMESTSLSSSPSSLQNLTSPPRDHFHPSSFNTKRKAEAGTISPQKKKKRSIP